MSQRDENLSLEGMHCAGCETLIEEALGKLPGVLSARASLASRSVAVSFDEARVRLSGVIAAIEDAAYDVRLGGAEGAVTPKQPSRWLDTLKGLALFAVVAGLVVGGIKLMPGVMMHMQDPEAGYSMILLVGFLTGFHCIGMCGSFVVSYATAAADRGRGSLALAHLAYGFGKTLSYAILGAVFGALGAVMTITPFMRGAVAIAAGLFLVLYGMRMLNLFTGLAWLNWAFPKSVMRGVQTGMRRRPRPLVTGLLTGFLLGCGALQAMYIMAAGTGSPREGALLLTFFSIGTLIPLLGFGTFAHLLSPRMRNQLLKVSGLLVLVMGLMMANRGLRLTETGFDWGSLWERLQVLLHDAAMHSGEPHHH
jgi:sulfite exporter TauE/SafE/copper chaperone CopZ